MYTQKLYGYRFGEYINKVGWDKGDCWFAHCCMLNEPEQVCACVRLAGRQLHPARAEGRGVQLRDGVSGLLCGVGARAGCLGWGGV